MPEYESYKDSNGVTWTVMSAANGWTMLASVLDSADPKYDPPPADEMAMMPPVESFGGVMTPVPTAEQKRVIFTELRNKIEAFAKAHRGAAVLKVTAAPPTWWWIVGAGIAWYLLGEGKRRR